MSAREIIRRDRERKDRKAEERAARRILRLPEVEHRTGLKHTAIYDGMAGGTFPRPVPLGLRAVGWLEDEIDQWIDQRQERRDTNLGPQK
jgi:prophage regulatory protein